MGSLRVGGRRMPSIHVLQIRRLQLDGRAAGGETQPFAEPAWLLSLQVLLDILQRSSHEDGGVLRAYMVSLSHARGQTVQVLVELALEVGFTNALRTEKLLERDQSIRVVVVAPHRLQALHVQSAASVREPRPDPVEDIVRVVKSIVTDRPRP